MTKTWAEDSSISAVSILNRINGTVAEVIDSKPLAKAIEVNKLDEVVIKLVPEIGFEAVDFGLAGGWWGNNDGRSFGNLSCY
jgi:hypothetical protein